MFTKHVKLSFTIKIYELKLTEIKALNYIQNNKNLQITDLIIIVIV